MRQDVLQQSTLWNFFSTHTVFLGFVYGSDFIGSTPKQEWCYYTPPHFCHDVKDGKRPIAYNGQGSRETAGKVRCQHVDKSIGMQQGTVGINEKCKERKECQERPYTGVKDILLFHTVGKGGVDSGETLQKERTKITNSWVRKCQTTMWLNHPSPEQNDDFENSQWPLEDWRRSW